MKEQYRQLLHDSDVDADNGEALVGRKRRASLSALVHWFGHVAAIIIVLILAVLNVVQHSQKIEREFRSTRLYPPLQKIARYSTRTYDHVMFRPDEPQSVFQGKPRPELDEAWAGIMNFSQILITEQDMNRINESTQNAYTRDGKYFALVDVFHQLHCVDLVRKYVYRGSYPEYLAFHDSEDKILYHVDHCLDIFRQKIMCDADIDLFVYNKPRAAGKSPEPRFAYPRLCRNYEDIRQWSWDNAWNKG